MKILLFGAGGIGAYFGGRLSQGGAEVSVFVRSNADLIEREGYKIKSIAGDFTFHPAKIFTPQTRINEPFDILMICTKALDDIDLPQLVAPAVRHGKPAFMLIQNGIGIEDKLMQAYPENEIISSIAYIGVSKSQQNQIRHGGGGRIVFGPVNRKISESIAPEVKKYFDNVKLEAKVVDNIQYYRWEKLTWNVPFNSVSVLGGGLLTNEMTDRAELEKLCVNLIEEVIATASSTGIMLPDELISKQTEYTRNFPPYQTSMLLDSLNGRELEVESIVGNVCRIAAQNQVPTPHLDTIYALLKSVNAKIVLK